MKTTKVILIWSIVIGFLAQGFGQFTKFDPSNAINSQGAVDNYMALDERKKALRREKIIAERSKKSLLKVKIN